MTDLNPSILIVVPVFNEESAVREVLREWFDAVSEATQRFVFLVIDDGSTDRTLSILREMRHEFGSRLEYVSRKNRGHGQTCLEGYRAALERGIPFVFQIDSDGQCDPRFFQRFWELRDQYDVIYGKRTREDGYRRILASFLLKGLLRVACNVRCVDPNVPYRLMRTSACAPAFTAIPKDFFLANVAVAVALKRMTALRHGEVPIRFLKRHGGEPSVPFRKFALKAHELFRQLQTMEQAAPRSGSLRDPS